MYSRFSNLRRTFFLLGSASFLFSAKIFAVTQTFNYTGSGQTFTIPATVTNITVTLTGGSGGNGGNDAGRSGGAGSTAGRVTGTLAVTPGEVLTLFIGGAGGNGSDGRGASGGWSGASGGAPLGGAGGSGGNSGTKSFSSSGSGGGGGGATWLYRSTNTANTNNILAVAGGGGGGGGAGGSSGGASYTGGYVSGTYGYNGLNRGSSDGGGSGAGGGGYTAGGAAGSLNGGSDGSGNGGSAGANFTNRISSPSASYISYSGTGTVQIVYNGLPTAPVISGTTDLGAVSLSWSAPASALAITDYVVQYRLGSSGGWTTFNDGTSATTGARVTGLTAGSSYQFQVAAVNSDGTGPYSSPLTLTVSPDIVATFASAATVPVTVSSLTATGASLTVNLSYAPLAGQKLTVVNNTGAGPVTGTFTGLAEGAEVTATYNGDTFKFKISYVGGTGNDVVLTRTSGVGAGTVSTLAGSGTAGSANGTGTAASFRSPGTTAVDANGNVYIADTANHVIRRIDPLGAVTTLAGTAGSAGSANGTGSAARFSSPSGIVVDSTGANLYVADTGNHQIRKIVISTGVVTTVAGSTTSGNADASGTSARFNGPKALALNSAGTDLFIADSGNHRIRRIVLSSTAVTTIAGSSNGYLDGNGTAAQFSNPSGIAVDSTGVIWVADTDNARIRRITAASPFTVSSVVDSSGGLTGFSGGGDGSNLIKNGNFQSGNTNFTSAYGYVAPAARALYPEGLYSIVAQASQVHDAFSSSFDKTLGTSSGKFLVANAAPDTTKTVWQSSPIGVSQANSPYRFEAYITKVHGDNPPSLVFEIGDGTNWQSLGTTASLASSGVGSWVFTYADGSFAQPGVFYVRLKNNNAAAGGNDLGVDDIYFGVRSSSPSIGSTPGSATVPSYSVAGISGILLPVGISVDAAGTLYVTDAAISRIRTIGNYGAGTSTFLGSSTAGWQDGPSGSARFYNPTGVAIDPVGNLYVADSGNHRIRRVSFVGLPFSPILTLGSAVQSTAGVTLSGTVNPNGFITTASFQYGTSESALNQTAAVTLPGANNGSTAQNVSATLSSLAVGTYFYRLTATNVDGAEITETGTFTVSPRWNTANANFASTSTVPVTSAGMSLEGATLNLALGFAPGPGTSLTLLNNTSSNPVSGTFSGLPQGSTVTATYGGDTFTFQINYRGGDGNDIVLTRVGGPGQIENVIVSTLAGSGSFGAADGTGAGASFNYAWSVAVDASGNIYVADLENHRIRKITPAGVVTTLAGSSKGYADGTGTAAKFSSPSGVAVDASGNVYVADMNNHRIRKITPAGVVTTLAGSGSYRIVAGKYVSDADGTGTAAEFNAPNGLAVDASGNVYVADEQNHRIRKITPAGVVTTLAGSSKGYADGTGSGAQFSFPSGVSVDATGNVYVADRGNHRIRKITPAGAVTTLAGSSSGYGKADGTGSAAQFYFPRGVAVDASGNIYVADTDNSRIRKITPAGVVTTLVGIFAGFADGPGSIARFRDLFGLAVDASGNIYVADLGNSRIRKIGADYRPILTLGAASQVGGDLRLTGTVNPNGFITTASFEYGTNSTNLNLSTLITLSPNNGTNALAVTNLIVGLTPNVTQFFRLTASNVDGTSVSTNGSFRLLPPSTITFAGVSPKTYGDAAFPLSATSSAGSGFTSQITYTSSDPSVATVSGNVVTIRGAGPVTITASHPGSTTAGNGVGTLSLNIAKRALTARAANLAYPSGQALPAFGLVYSGFVNGDNASVLDTPPTVTASPSAPTAPGTYTLTPSGGSDNSYTFSLSAGTLTLLAAGGKIPLISPNDAPVTLGSFDGTGWALDVDLGFAPGASQTVTLVNNLGSSAAVAPFTGLPEGSTFTTTYGGDTFQFRISYTGGDGNDVTLTRLLKPGQTPVNFVSTLAGSGECGRVDGNGTNAAFSFNTSRVYSYEAAPSLKLTVGGNLIVREKQDSSMIRVVTPSGQVTTVAQAPIYTNRWPNYYSLPSPWSSNLADLYPEMVSDASGNAYFCTYGSAYRVSPAGVVFKITNLPSVLSVATDATGNLYGASYYELTRMASNGTTTTLSMIASTWINGIGAGLAGDVYVSDSFTDGIRLVNSSNQVSSVVGQIGHSGSSGYRDGPANTAKVSTPGNLVVDGAGVVYFLDTGNQRIRKIAPAAPPIVTLSNAIAHTVTNAAVLSGTVNPNGYITTARFEYGTNSTNLNLFTNLTLAPNNGTNALSVSAVVPDLNVSATYFYRLTAVNVDGSVSSESLNFRRSSLRTPSVITWPPLATTNFTYPLMSGSSYTNIPLSASNSSGQGVHFSINPAGSGASIVFGGGSSQAAQINAPGTYTIMASAGLSSPLYENPAPVSQTVTIGKGSLEVNVWNTNGERNTIRRPYGQPNPDLGSVGVIFTGNGFIHDFESLLPGEIPNNLGGLIGVNGAPGYTTTANSTSLPGIYPVTLTPGNLSHPKYDFTYATNVILVVTAPNINFSWSGLNPTFNPGGNLAPVANTDPAGLPVALSYNGSSSLPTAAGTYSVVATVTDPTLGLTVTSTNTYVVAKAIPSLNFAPLPTTVPLNQLTNVAVSATASGGVGVTLSLDPGSVATLSGTLTDGTGTLGGIQSTGTVYLRATTTETANYASTTQLFTIDVTKNNQSITFNQNLPDITFAPSTTINLTGTASGGGAVAYTVTGPATLSGNTLTITGAGEVTVTADQPGDGLTAAAPSVVRSFTVAKAANSLSFDLSGLAAPTFGDAPIDLTPYLSTLPSGATRSLEVVSGAATISGNQLTITGAGPIVIRAVQPENDKYLAATPVEQTIQVGKRALTIAAVSTNRPAGQDNPAFAVNYNGRIGSAPLQVPPTVTSPATTASAPGTYAITAANASDVNYTIAYEPGTLTVQQATPSIAWEGQTNPVVYGTPLTSAQLGASAGTIPGSITYTVNGSPLALGGLLPAGTHQVVATFTPDDTTSYAVTTLTNPVIVAPRPIEIVAEEQGKVAGAADATDLSYRLVGSLANGDSLTGSLGRQAGEGVGSYQITLGTLAISPSSSASNYDLTFTPAAYTVSADPLAVIREYTGLNTAPAEADYAGAGIIGVDAGNLAAINSAFALLTPTESDSVPEIQNVVDSYLRILAEANGSVVDDDLSSNPGASDYTNIGINLRDLTSTAGGMPLLNDVVGAQSASGVGSIGQIQALVDIVDRLGKTAAGQSVTPALTSANLLDLGLVGVSSTNLAAVLSAIGASADDGSGISSLPSLQGMIDAYSVILASADGNRDGDDFANAAQYAAIGVTGVSAGAGVNLLGNVMDGLGTTAVDSVPELQSLADAVAGVLAGAAGTANEPASADLQALGITGVTSGNLAAIQAAIAAGADDGSGADSVAKLQALVDGAIAGLDALARIRAYDGTNSAPTSADYASAGVTGVTAGNLAAINSAIGPIASGSTDSVAEVQAVVDAFLRILAEADGSTGDLSPADPSEADYTAVGVTLGGIAGNANGLSLLNDGLGILPSTSADSVAELNSLAALINRLLSSAAGETPAISSATIYVLRGHVTNNPANPQVYRYDGVANLRAGLHSSVTTRSMLHGFSSDIAVDDQGRFYLVNGDPTSTNATVSRTIYRWNSLADWASNNSPVLVGTRTNNNVPLAGFSVHNNEIYFLQSTNATNGNVELRKWATGSDWAAGSAGTSVGVRWMGGGVNLEIDQGGAIWFLDSAFANTSGILYRWGNTSDWLANLGISNGGSFDFDFNGAAAGGSDPIGGLAIAPALLPADFSTLGLSGVTPSTLSSVVTAIAGTADDGSGISTLQSLQGVINNAISSSTASALAIISAYNGTQTGAGIPSATTYEQAGVNGVTSGNLSAMNNAIAGLISSDKYTQPQVQGIVDAYNRILAQANGASADEDPLFPTTSDYIAIGVNLGSLEFSNAGVSLLNDIIGAKSATAVDTVAEIEALLGIPQRLLVTAAGGTAAPAITAAELSGLGLTGITTGNLPSFLSAVAATADNGSGIATLAALQGLADAYAGVLAGAAGTANRPTLAELLALGITGVDATNLATVQAAIQGTSDSGSGVDTIGELQAVVDTVSGVGAAALAKISGAAENNSAYTGDPTLADYSVAGISGVNAGNLSAINSALNAATVNGAATDTAAEVQGIVDAYTAILTAADGTGGNGVAPSAAQYTIIGVTGVSAGARVNLLGEVIDRSAGTAVDTVAEIQGLADAVEGVMAGAAGTANRPTLAELLALGVTGVGSNNISAVQMAIAATADSGAGVDSLSELQAVVSGAANVINALAAITGAAENNTATATSPAAADYSTAGVTGVSAGNLSVINGALNTTSINGAAADTTAEIQAIVDAYVAILAAADGTAGNGSAPATAHYASLGVTGVTAGAATSLLGGVIDAKSSGSVDTVAEIQGLADAVADVLAGAAGTTNQPSLADLTALGINGATSGNLAMIQAAIAATANDGSGVDTLTKLQGLVDGVVSSISSALATISGAAQNNNAVATPVADTVYAAAGVTGVDVLNVGAINSALDSAGVNGAAADTTAEVQAIVDAYVAILGAADGSADSDTAPTAIQYTQIGVTGVSGGSEESLLGSVIDGLSGSAVDTVAEVQALADAVGGVIAGAGGAANQPTLTDLQALNLPGVNSANLAAVQAAIAASADDGSEVDTLAELESLVAGVTLPANALAAIRDAAQGDSATATSPAETDYSDAGVTGVNSANLGAINSALNTATVNGAAADTTAEIQAIVDAYLAILGAADGSADGDMAPTAVQYAQIGVTGVSSTAAVDLLGSVIDPKSGADVDTVIEVQALADAVKAVLDYATGVSSTAPSLSQLQALGLSRANSTNLAGLLAALAGTADDGSGADTLSKLQALVPVLTAADDSLVRDGQPGSSTSIAVAQVLANDDYVGSVAPTVSLLSGASTQGGTVILDNGWFVYTSPSNLASSSTDSFLYRITDSQGNTADGTVTLTAGDYSAVAVNIVSVMDANAPATGKNVTFAVVPNKLYKIYATSSLSSPITWTDLTPVGSLYPGGSNGFITINDAAAGSARFYKLEEVR